MLQKIILALRKKWQEEGNGAVITHKNGKIYEVWAQEDGRFLMTDKTSIWVPETYRKSFNTIEELAKEIASL